MYQKLILTLILILIGQIGLAQTFDEKIERVIEIQQQKKPKEYWTMMISEIVEANTRNNPNLSEKEIEELKKKLINNELQRINSDILALTKKYHTEKDIDALLAFFESEIGQKLREASEGYFDDWIELEETTTKRLRDEVVEMIDTYEGETNEEYIETVEILTEKYLEINEESEQSIVIDFGDVTGQIKVTKIVKIKNTSKRNIVLSSFSDVLDNLLKETKDEITIEFDKKPIRPKEVREIKFVLDAYCVQGNIKKSASLGTGIGTGISYQLIYFSQGSPMNFSIVNEKLKFKKFEGLFSTTYEFKIKNKGFSNIRIKDVRLTSKIAYVNYNQELISKGEEIEINVIYSKELMRKYEEEDINLVIEVDIQRCDNEHSRETIYLEIEK